MLAQLLAQHLHLAQRVLPLDDLVEQNLQPLRLDRLGQIVVRAFLDRLDRGLHRTLRGEDHDRQRGPFVLERAQQLEPAHARHHEVGDHDGRAERGDTLKRFLTVGGGLGGEAPGAYQFGQAGARGRLVLDDENALSRSGRCHLIDTSLSFLHGPAEQ